MGRLLLAAICVVLLAPVVPAAAQTARAVEEAATRLDAAHTVAAAAAVRRAGAHDEMLAAVDRYQAVSAELMDVAGSVTGLIDELHALEARARAQRGRVRDAVRRVYYAAVGGEGGLALWSSSVAESALAAELGRRATDRDLAAVVDFEAVRAELGARRADLEEARFVLGILRDEADAEAAAVAGHLGAAERTLLAAETEAAMAREAYEVAVAELEARRRRVGSAVVRWEELVAAYFPEERRWEALEVMSCESNGDPEAVNPVSGATGLFQFLDGTWLFASAAAGFGDADRTEPEANIAAAAWLVRHSELLAHPRGAWGHWACQPLAGAGDPAR